MRSRPALWLRAWCRGRGSVTWPISMADKYGLFAWPVSQWRCLSRKGKLVLPGDRVQMFVPLVVEPVGAPDLAAV